MPSAQVFTPAEHASFRKAGAILGAALRHISAAAVPGVTTLALDALAEAFIRDHGGKPAFFGYNGYKYTLCTSINDECVHGIPSKRALSDGDIVSLDCGVIVDGLYTDACVTVGVGKLLPPAKRLLSVTKDALDAALHVLKGGVRVGDVSAAVQEVVERGGCHCIPVLTGHGLGTTLHQFPDIPNVGRAGTGPVLPAGTVIAVEPIVSLGSTNVFEADDGWTIKTRDGSLCAHFEHTVLLTKDGCEVIA